MIPEEVIIKPVITEKSNEEIQDGKYTFKVNKKATKIDIKRACEKLFNVKVLKVNTTMVKGKTKRTFSLPFTYTELADYLSIDRSAMQRELKNLKDEGFITTNGKKITLNY